MSDSSSTYSPPTYSPPAHRVFFSLLGNPSRLLRVGGFLVAFALFASESEAEVKRRADGDGNSVSDGASESSAARGNGDADGNSEAEPGLSDVEKKGAEKTGSNVPPPYADRRPYLGLGFTSVRPAPHPHPDWVAAMPRGYLYSGYHPWPAWYVPQAAGYKHALYPPPVAVEPRLGLQYNYPFAWQAGIRVPIDGDPHNIPDMPPFEGLVGRLKRALQEAEAEAQAGEEEEGVGLPGEARALALMRRGAYREAGKVLAAEFRRDDNPRYAFLLSEVFFALGKFEHAELTLEHGLARAKNAAVIPTLIPSHFSSAEEFEGKLAKLLEADGDSLLAAYYLLASKDAERGVTIITRLAKRKPESVAISTLYRSALDKAF